MVKLNFKQFKIYTRADRSQSHLLDVRESLADMVYVTAVGAFAVSLSQRILHTEGEEEYDEREVDIIRTSIDKAGGKAFLMDSFNAKVEEQTDNGQTDD